MPPLPVVGDASLHFQYRQRWARLPRVCASARPTLWLRIVGRHFRPPHGRAMRDDLAARRHVRGFVGPGHIAPGAHGMLITAKVSRNFSSFRYDGTCGCEDDPRRRVEVSPYTCLIALDIYSDDERLFIPTECAVARNGNIYVTDGYGQPWVHI